MLPLVECWVYRNFRQIRITENKMMASLRLELLTSPGIERALRSATSRLGVLLSDYRDCCPDISIRSLQMLGYGPSRAAPLAARAGLIYWDTLSVSSVQLLDPADLTTP